MLEEILAARGPLVVVTGATGTGKTTLLAQLSDRLREEGHEVTAVTVTASADVLPIRFEPGEHTVRLESPDRAATLFGPVPGAAEDAELARRAAAMIAGQLYPKGVLLIDDAHCLDPDSLAVLRALIRARVRCVCTAEPGHGPLPELSELIASEMVDRFRLAPLSRGAVAHEITRMLTAKPEPALVDRVREISRGLPAALQDTVDAMRANGSIQVVDRRAYLMRPHTHFAPAAETQLLRAIRALGDDCWTAAKALSVLIPLGPRVPNLLATSTGIPQDQVAGILGRLRRAGVVHLGRTWRFVVPLVRAALLASLGPFERRRLSKALVEAIWEHGVPANFDPDEMADRVADAGILVDADRALRELLHQVQVTHYERAESAVRWLAAAVDLAPAGIERGKVLLQYTVTCFLLGEYDQTLTGVQRILAEHVAHLSPDALQEVHELATRSLRALGEHEALREIAAGDCRWPGTPAQLSVTRALAMGHLDRWQEAADLLRTTESEWRSASPATVMLGELTWALAELWTGKPERFERRLTAAQLELSGKTQMSRRTEFEGLLTALLTIGDVGRAERLLAAHEFTENQLPLYCRSMLAATRGHATEAVDFARRSIAGTEEHGREARAAGMYVSAVWMLVARGELITAQQLLAAARATPPILGHLVEVAEALVERAFGDEEAARLRLFRCASETSEAQLTVGLELVWSELIDMALARGDRAETEQGLAALERLPQTERTRLLTLLARAMVDKDEDAARECEKLARERAQPLELALVLQRLVHHGGAEPRLLSDAYELLGSLDAVLYRAWARNLMREHGVKVPGRKETVAENERLLAMLAAAGLTNKQLAAALRTSEKSVEGRLSRLFLHTGYRSRIELSTAILNGEYLSECA